MLNFCYFFDIILIKFFFYKLYYLNFKNLLLMQYLIRFLIQLSIFFFLLKCFIEMLFERFSQSLLKSFDIFTISIRHNCPWHRSNFTPCHIPFYMKKKVNGDSKLKKN